MRKGFSSEAAAVAFAATVQGSVHFKPLPDYMSMIPYWVVTWEEGGVSDV